ncbi:putative membrane protein [Isoptericola sp. CG 20/1183]|uniref:Membrane protein n=1 Tax=Isoptericola halotolerans TaxID=300560 RepID=A0ABX5ECZ5_9MICO|nr:MULTISPECIES: DoxX family protein [Isoptericola]MCK0117105.1 DoxX family protein [Isoptericola sp. S6320L]PRZ05704.1 putative membrane protein [Isoptericola halotolerans]PRZ06272.1 putative membrane protein [Isoptericola sp. CG 20/1183]
MPRHTDVLAGSLAAALTVTGTLHFARPRAFDALIPPALGSPRAWVYGSGVAELACAAAVAVPATRRVGGLATAALFVAVFPGNVKMALDSHPGARSWARKPSVAWGRLPLQVPLVAWAWRVARTAPSVSARRT